LYLKTFLSLAEALFIANGDLMCGITSMAFFSLISENSLIPFYSQGVGGRPGGLRRLPGLVPIIHGAGHLHRRGGMMIAETAERPSRKKY